MRGRALVVAVGLALVAGLVAGLRRHSAARGASDASFKPQPVVEIAGKGFGSADLEFLETGETPWPFSTPGFSERTLSFPKPLDLRAFAAITIPLKLSGSDIGRVRTKLRFVHHNGWVYETWKELPLYFGDHGDLKVDISADSSDMVPVGHGRPWDGESARAIRQITLSVHSEGTAHGWLVVGAPKLEDVAKPGDQRNESAFASGVTAPWPPLDVKLFDFAATQAGNLVDVRFRLDPAPPDPYDPEHCDLRVLLVHSSDEASLSGKLQSKLPLPPELVAQARPAFFDQAYFLVEGARNFAEELKPLGAPSFHAHIPIDPIDSVNRSENPDVAAVLILNGHVFARTQISVNTASLEAPAPASAPASATLDQAPLWTVSGGESFCEFYRPRAEWTGMPWRAEAARYIGGSTPAPVTARKAEWSYGPWTDFHSGDSKESKEKTDKAEKADGANSSQKAGACWVAPIEWNEAWGKWQGLGRYDLELCWRFDRILEKASAENVRLPLLLTSDTMFFNQGKYRWPMNPLCADAGGPLSGSGQFFSDTPARDNFRRRLRYLSARYGTRAALGGWLFGATLPANRVPDWHREMAALLTSLDEARGWYRSGKSPLSEGVPERGTDAARVANRLAHPIVSLHPWATEFERVTRKNSFEPGSPDYETWTAEQRLSPGTRKRLSTDLASDGHNSVALRSANMPGQVCLMRELLFKTAEADNFYDYRTLVFEVYVPPSAPHDMRAVVHFRDRDELWYEALLDPLLRPGEWTRLVIDITGDNMHHLKPVNHMRPWDDYSRTRLREIGFRIFCGHKFDGEINIDNIFFAGEQIGRIPPKITPVVEVRGVATKQIQRFDKWELDFDLNKSYPNPYDPEVVDVSARIKRPDGVEVVVPAFFYEPYDRRLVDKEVIPEPLDEDEPHVAKVEEIVPVAGGMKGYWKLRYSPEMEGAHSVVLEVREGGKWRMESERWIADDRFTRDGQPVPGSRPDFNQFTEIDDRHDDGRRKLQELAYQQGAIVARGEPITFSVAGAKNHGPIRRANDARYLEHADGTFFYPVGMNLSTPSEEQLPFMGGRWRPPKSYRLLRDTGRRGTYQYDDYFDQFEKHKLNWGKLWMATWWTAQEWRRDWPPYQGAGRYSQPNAWRMDYLVEAARAKGIFLQVILMNHGQISSGINHDWENNPYNVELGGPVKSAREFYSDYNAKRLFKNKLRYIAARWGYSTSILDWTICGEMDFTEDYQTNSFDLMTPANDKPAPESMVSWLEEMGGYMKNIDSGKHLIGTHVSHPQRGQNIQQAKVLDYVQSNAYSGFPWLANGSMNAAYALTAYYYGQGGQNHFKGMHAFEKPVLICEQGGHWHGISKKYGNWTRNTRESLDADLHCGLWAGLMTPLAGQTGYWWWLHVHFDGGYEQFEAVQNFMQGEDLRGQDFNRNNPRLDTGGKSLEALGFYNSKHGFAWIYGKSLPYRLQSEEFTGVKAFLADVEAGSYQVEYWDTNTGKVVSRAAVDAEENVTKDGYILPLTLPTFEGDVAVKFKKR